MISSVGLLLALAPVALPPALAFQVANSSAIMARSAAMGATAPPATAMASSTTGTAAGASTAGGASGSSHLYVPSERDARYTGNIAQYLLDLDDAGATFDFCGGMMFQLVLSEKLKSHLATVASSNGDPGDQPVFHPASQPLMSRTPDYQKSSFADNVSLFHGRELRRVPAANGGMGFVLQLSYVDPSGASAPVDGASSSGAAAGKGADAAWTGSAVDPEGWSAEEIATYDGWRGDSLRKWRNRAAYESEGFAKFGERFGEDAYGLNHRFFLHLDGRDRMWLSAEDGCEGTPSEGKSLMSALGGLLFGK